MEYELGGDRAVIIVSALVAIAIEFLYFSVKRQHLYRGVPLQRQLVFPCTRSCYKTENSTLLRLWPYQGMKHTVSQNGEFIARYCKANDNDKYASAPLPASLFATAKFLSLFLLCHY